MSDSGIIVSVVLGFIAGFILGVTAGAGSVEDSALEDCRTLGGTRINEKTVVCSVKP